MRGQRLASPYTRCAIACRLSPGSTTYSSGAGDAGEAGAGPASGDGAAGTEVGRIATTIVGRAEPLPPGARPRAPRPTSRPANTPASVTRTIATHLTRRRVQAGRRGRRPRGKLAPGRSESLSATSESRALPHPSRGQYRWRVYTRRGWSYSPPTGRRVARTCLQHRTGRQAVLWAAPTLAGLILAAGAVTNVSMPARTWPAELARIEAPELRDPKVVPFPEAESPSASLEVPTVAPPAFAPVVPVKAGRGPVLPERRIVAYYGNPLTGLMGVLGEQPLTETVQRLRRQAQAYADADPLRPVQPAFQVITPVAQDKPGLDGLFRLRMSPDVLDEVAELAERE